MNAPSDDPTPSYDRHGVQVFAGDCLDVLATMAADSIDAVVCDPPYGLEFMGREWDSFRPSSARLRTRVDGRTNPTSGKSVTTTPEAYVAGHPFQQWCESWARECFRVLKPGAYIAAFGGTRTYHRLACGIEDAGFEVRDSIGAPLAAWMHGQGFPKGKNQLKPAWEPIVLARKPPAGTLAANLLTHGTGQLGVDACRTAMSDADADAINAKHAGMDVATYERAAGVSLNLSISPMPLRQAEAHDGGRWPTNVLLVHDAACAAVCTAGCPIAELDAQSGTSKSPGTYTRGTVVENHVYGASNARPVQHGHGDSGSASRFFPVFRWEAKAPTAERPQVDGVAHPTVKPLDLMRWLVRLVTPSGGLVLDPFAGSGTTLHAARAEGFRAVGIEREPTYLPLIKARLDARPRQAQAAAVPVPDDEPMDLLDLLGDAS